MKHERFTQSLTLRIACGGLALAGATLAEGCAASNAPIQGGGVTVEAVVQHANGLDVIFNDHTKATLPDGQKVTAICIDGSNGQGLTLDAVVEGGKYNGLVALGVPADDLPNATDPGHAAEQKPPQDPYAPLDMCVGPSAS